MARHRRIEVSPKTKELLAFVGQHPGVSRSTVVEHFRKPWYPPSTREWEARIDSAISAGLIRADYHGAGSVQMQLTPEGKSAL